jgi:hypothetical protein
MAIISMTPTATNLSESDPLKPLQGWLAALNPDEYLYAIISAASEAEPVRYYFQLDGATIAWPLYANTPYADWYPVMPYLMKLSRTSPFLDWVNTTESTDWGWLFSSTQEADELAPHFSSLTQATMPDGDRVFFRYWDADYFSLILSHQHEQTCSLIPAMTACWVNSHTFTFQPDNTSAAKPFAWWQLPESLLKELANADPRPLITNLLQYLQEYRGDLWRSFPKNILENKVRYFVENYQGAEEKITAALCEQLSEEQTL